MTDAKSFATLSGFSREFIRDVMDGKVGYPLWRLIDEDV